MQVLILRKRLAARPQIPAHDSVVIHGFQPVADAQAWLTLREAAFAGEEPPVGRWGLTDVQRELGDALNSRRQTWLARPSAGDGPPCGAISLSPPSEVNLSASVHWLMVDPHWRRCGVGTLLLAVAEQFCWERGWRELRLETHRGWRAAEKFYYRHGYAANSLDGCDDDGE